MDGREQIEAFAEDLDRLIERYRSEFDLTYAAVVGALTIKSHILCTEAAEQADEE
jgi:hypothetical protein